MRYNFKDFDAQFPDDAACLEFIFRARFANHKCECGKSDCFYRIQKRRAYSCSFCGAQIYPTAGTIFHKSETSLKTWFFAIFLFAKSKNGVATKELQRQLGVSYKTAWRIGHQIRALMFNSIHAKARESKVSDGTELTRCQAIAILVATWQNQSRKIRRRLRLEDLAAKYLRQLKERRQSVMQSPAGQNRAKPIENIG